MNISRFIRLRRFENFSLKQCMHEQKISKFPLLSDKHSSCNLSTNMVMHSGRCEANGDNSGRSVRFDKVVGTDFVKQKILKCWIYWFFSCLVVPLLQANFYVTECEGGKQELFYFQKAVWQKVISETVTRLETQNFHHMNDASLREILRYRTFGYSNARLCPKGSGVRVLANLKAPSKIPVRLLPSKGQSIRQCTSVPTLKRTEYQMFKSVNSVLHNIHVILKGIQMKQPDKLGSSVFDYNDVYKRFVPFVSLLRNGCTTIPKVSIIVADVSRAFDSVNQKKLLEVVKTVLVDDEYRLRKSDKVICTKTSFRVQQLLLSTHHDGHSQPGILVNQGLSIIIKKKNIVSDLVEHIKHNILKLGDEFYLQSVGIPQGSILSSLLCSFYYGHMEKNVINPYLKKLSYSRGLEDLSELHSDNTSTNWDNSAYDTDFCNAEYLLVRFIDDYLFMSTSEQQASQFFSLLRRGFCDYNAFMNESKFGSNFHVNHKSQHEASRVFVGQDGISFLKWSGLLINTCTLEIQADYSRYLGCHLSSTLTVCWRGKTYSNLRAKLCDYLRPKCHPIFYDANINSPPVVRLNIYQVFLLCAMKFHSYVSSLFNLGRLDISSIMRSLEFSLRYLHKLIKKRNLTIFRVTSVQPSFNVEKREIEWLGLFAYIRVLKRKQSRYGSMLHLLESKLKSLPINENVSPALMYATDDVHSSLFWKIKY
ncbi:hypothetical protein Leryth_021198 [Lithospermum erythrorhizon]|nr:hypothetical protein Leryth_021198 [Lithospermum erythrorhizon]